MSASGRRWDSPWRKDVVRAAGRRYEKSEKRRETRRKREADPAFKAARSEYEKARRASGKNLAAELQREFGMALAAYRALEVDQGGRCAICARQENDRRLSVDHDHASGRVRGLLCKKCNTAIGLLGDNVERIEAAARYLRRAQ